MLAPTHFRLSTIRLLLLLLLLLLYVCVLLLQLLVLLHHLRLLQLLLLLELLLQQRGVQRGQGRGRLLRPLHRCRCSTTICDVLSLQGICRHAASCLRWSRAGPEVCVRLGGL